MHPLKKFTLALIALLLLSYFGYKLFPSQKVDGAVFTTIEGKTFSMASLKGKVVLVSFWATDCVSCVKEMPDLINTYKLYKNKGLEIIAVAMPYDPPLQVVNFAKQKALPFPVMHDSYAEITQLFGGINLTPTAYLYNKDGERIQRAVGILNFDKLHALLDQELN
jgi:thiol-disulfide isomerase/thioredoxin